MASRVDVVLATLPGQMDDIRARYERDLAVHKLSDQLLHDIAPAATRRLLQPHKGHVHPPPASPLARVSSSISYQLVIDIAAYIT